MKLTKPVVACTADLHLGVHCDSPEWHKISLDFVEWLKDTLLKRNIQDIIIAGDIFNNRNEVSVLTIDVLPKLFHILKDFNITLIVGNHDCFFNDRADIHSIGSLDGWSNITVVEKPTTITAFGKVLTFCPWGTDLTTIPNSDTLFGHFEVQTFKMSTKSICSKGLHPKQLFEKSKNVVSGHFHITDFRGYTEGQILYLGSPYELNWGDYMSPKGIYLYNIETNNFEFVTNDKSPQHKKINLSEIIALGKLPDNMKKEITGNIVNLVIDVQIDEKVVEKILDKLQILRPFSLKPDYVVEAEAIEVSTTKDFSGVDIRASLIEYIQSLENVEYKEETSKYMMEKLSQVEKEHA